MKTELYLHQRRFEQALGAVPLSKNEKLHQAMAYSLFTGGKRLRPLLVYFTGEALHAPLNTLDAPAIAIELIHTFSLIHDDLPALDNDDYRRNQLTCHKKFGEDMAILAGDGLLALAFEHIAKDEKNLSLQQRLQMISALASATGLNNMTGGQAMELTNATPTEDELILIYRKKTGALIQASIELGIIAAKCSNLEIVTALRDFAMNIGLAFQIQDDLDDLENKTKKTNKMALPLLIGVNACEKKIALLYQKAIDSLKAIHLNNSPLATLARHILRKI